MFYYLINIFHLTLKAKIQNPKQTHAQKPRVRGFGWGYLVAMRVHIILEVTFLTLSSLHMGYIPHVVMTAFKEGHIPTTT
jgi:hypothetical protein